MPFRRYATVAVALAFLAACGSKDAVAPTPRPPASWTKLTQLGNAGFGIARTNDGHLLTTLIQSGFVERILLSNPSAPHEGLGVGGTPSVIVTSPNGSVFYIANMAGWVEARNSASGVQIGYVNLSDAHSLTVSPDGSRLYVAGSAGHLYVLDAASLATLATVDVPGGPWGIAFRSVGGSPRLFVTARDGGTITEIDRTSNTILHAYAVGGRPHGLVITPDGGRLYAADNQSGVIKIVDANSGIVTRQIPFPGAFSLAISPDGKTIYAGGDLGTAGILDVGTSTVTNSWATGGQPRQIVTTAEGDTAYFANSNGWIDLVVR